MSFLLRRHCWTLIFRALCMWGGIDWRLILNLARASWIRLKFAIAKGTARRCWNLWPMRRAQRSGYDLMSDSNVRMMGRFIRSPSRGFFLSIILTGLAHDARDLATP